jgi:membrane protein required for colicin V production
MDWVIASIFGYFIFKGFRKGFVEQLFELLASVFSFIFACYFYRSLGAILSAQLHFSNALANIIGFILIVILLSGGVAFIGKRWHASRKNEPIAVFDGGFGALFGGAKAALIIMIGLLILLALPWEFIHGPIESS